MKRTKTCLKCQSGQLLHVAHALNSERRDPAGCAALAGGRIAGTVLGLPPGAIELFVCQSCGYVEMYVQDPAALKVDGGAVRPLE